MSAYVSTSFRLSSPLKVEEDVFEKQGIVSILGTEGERVKAASLRRTLSADMSSKKWLAQNGFSPMKKIASSEELPISVADSTSSSSSEGEEEEEDDEGKNEPERPNQSDVWKSIQLEKEKDEKEEVEKPGQFDMWSSILSQNGKEDTSKLPPPYIHPLVKRSASTLSEKSLEVCTESLGSETGSDGFSSYPPSETGELEEDKEEVQQQQPPQPQPQEEEEKESIQSFDWEELPVVKYNYSSSSKKLAPQSFPPPLPSLTRGDGPSLHMRSYREKGRLVLEAVSIPPRNYFHAQRQEGRLLLTLVNSPLSQEPSHEDMEEEEEEKVEEFEEVFNNFEEDYDDDDDEDEEMEEEVVKENGAKDVGFVMEQAPKRSSGVINVHRSALMMKQLMGIDNRNTTWPHKFNKAVNLMEMEVEVEEEEEEPTIPLPQSLPTPPRVARLIPSSPATAASFNAYEYFWRTKPAVTSLLNPITQQCSPLKNNSNKAILSSSPKAYHEQQQVVLLTGNKADYIFPLFRSCKESRRSILIWEPYCIAT